MTTQQEKTLEKIYQQFLQGDFNNTSQWDNIIKEAQKTPLQMSSRAVLDQLQALVRRLDAKILRGNSNAMVARGYILEHGQNGPENYAEAIRFYEEGIKHENAIAMRLRACMHRDGKGGPESYKAAIRLLREASKRGDVIAHRNIAYMYHNGLGVSKSYAKAIHFYNLGIAGNDTASMNNLGLMYHYGQGVPVNYAEAIRLYDRAIMLGETAAMSNRALMHQYGQGGPQNYAEAIRLYDEPIKQGDTAAMNNRALMHKRGLGGPQNYAEAIRLYEEASKLGDAAATGNRARMYERGLGGPQDYVQALRLYECEARIDKNASQDNLKKITITTAADALQLLDLIWLELVDGKAFSQVTINIMKQFCKGAILGKIQNSPLGTSLAFLKTLRKKSQHPLTQILNDGQANKFTQEFKILMGNVHQIQEERVMLTKLFSQKAYIGSLELAFSTLSFFQSGNAVDRKCSAALVNIKDKIESELEQSDSLQPWHLKASAKKYNIIYREKTYQVPKDIYKIYALTQEEDNYQWDTSIRALIESKAKKPLGLFKRGSNAVNASKTRDFYKALGQILDTQPEIPFSTYLR